MTTDHNKLKIESLKNDNLLNFYIECKEERKHFNKEKMTNLKLMFVFLQVNNKHNII